jgi:pyrroline-5-carboxylate reductase
LGELVEDSNIIIIIIICAVKPPSLTPQFFAEASWHPTATILSVVAGKPIQAFWDGGFQKVARSLPNTPTQIGSGMTV